MIFQTSHTRNQKEGDFHPFLKTTNSRLIECLVFEYDTFSNNYPSHRGIFFKRKMG